VRSLSVPCEAQGTPVEQQPSGREIFGDWSGYFGGSIVETKGRIDIIPFLFEGSSVETKGRIDMDFSGEERKAVVWYTARL